MHSLPGTYALVLTPTDELPVKIGKFGLLQLRSGFYIYVGSAFGPGGLEARVAHHQKISKRPRWHIDYLRTVTRIEELWYTHDPVPREHQWAELLDNFKARTVPFPGFGSSDCNCKSHLFFFTSPPSVKSFRLRLYESFHDHAEVFIQK
jgi:Uri superfamily endonuclease